MPLFDESRSMVSIYGRRLDGRAVETTDVYVRPTGFFNIDALKGNSQIMACSSVFDAIIIGTPTRYGNMAAQMKSFLDQTVRNMGSMRNSLSEVLLAQGYQDLSGQIIRGVMNLVDELEVALGELIRLSGKDAEDGSNAGRVRRRSLQGNGHGPAIPGIRAPAAVNGQQDVDALLANLGM